MSLRRLLRRLVGRPSGADGPGGGDDLFRAMVERSGDVICHLEDRIFTYVSPSAAATFGWDPAAMVGTDGQHLIVADDLPVLQEVIAREQAGEAGPIVHQVRVRCGDGSTKWAETTAHSQPLAGGRTRTVLVIRDASERKRREAELAALALKDGLTGLANRRSFDERLERTWRETLRQGGEMALLMLDIDKFKSFNDAYGHQAGDDCLRAVAGVLGGFARRPADQAARYGGEEFALILGGTGAAAAAEIAEQLRAAVEALGIPNAGAEAGTLTVSIGAATAVARLGGTIRMPESLLQAADHALYKAKSGGRNRVELSVLIAPPGQG